MAVWDRDEGGLIMLRPLAGYETAVVAESAGALRIEHSTTQDPAGPRDALQLILTSAQAKTLAGALLRMAEQIERPAPPGVLAN